jgi:hypothetical protein
MTWDKFITTVREVQLERVIKLARASFHSKALFKNSSEPKNSSSAREDYTADHTSSWLPGQRRLFSVAPT